MPEYFPDRINKANREFWESREPQDPFDKKKKNQASILGNSTIKTCRYCQRLGIKPCPYIVAGLSVKIDMEACSQFIPLQDVSKFKERKEIDQKKIEVKKEAKKIQGPLKRAIDL